MIPCIRLTMITTFTHLIFNSSYNRFWTTRIIHKKCIICNKQCICNLAWERGDNRLFISLVPLSSLFVDLATLGTFIEFWLKSFRGNFVYHHRGCTSIYQPLFYPFRSLNLNKSYSITCKKHVKNKCNPLPFKGRTLRQRSYN